MNANYKLKIYKAMSNEEKQRQAEKYFEQGNAFSEQGDYVKAIESYNKAIESYNKIIELKPDYADAYFNLGNVYYNQGDYIKAIELYNKAIELKQDFAQAYCNLGNTYDNLVNYVKAIESYSKAIELKPDYTEVYYNLGNVYVRRGDHVRAIELEPDLAEAHNGLGFVYFSQDDYTKAIESYSKAIELEPDLAEAYYSLGIVYYKQGDYTNAIKSYTKAVELKPDLAKVYYKLGTVYDVQGDYVRAIESYNRSIELKPGLAKASYNLRIDYFNQDDYAKAMKWVVGLFNKLIKLKPDIADAYNALGIVYYKQGDYANAIESYNKSIELRSDQRVYNNLGDAYFNKGDYVQAIRSYNKAKIEPDYAEPYNGLGFVYFHLFTNNIIIKEYKIDINQILANWNTYIYLSRKTRKIKKIDTLTDFFRPYPQTIQTIRDYSNVNPSSLIFDIFEEANQSITDFSKLLQLYESIIPKQNKTFFLSIKAILYYYLGGTVSSYIIFDEQLDDDKYTLSSQEYYYYALTAKEMNREANTILNNAIGKIENRENKGIEDFYYLAHLYLLQDKKNKAIENFRQSGNFIFSIIMLAYLSDDDNPYLEQVKNINPEDIYNFSREIDYSRKDLSQFQHFFHLSECKDAIESFDENISKSLMPDEYNIPFWEVFGFSPLSEKNINFLINKIKELNIDKEIRIISDKYYQYYHKNIIEYAIKENKNVHKIEREIDAKKMLDKMENEFKSQIDKDIESKGKSYFDYIDIKLQENILETRVIMRDIEYSKGQNLSMDKVIGTNIEKLQHPKIEFYHYLIISQYYKKVINSNAAFYLYFYWLHTLKKKKINIEKLFFDLGKAIFPDVIIKIFLISAELACQNIKQILNEYEEFDPTVPSDYSKFKENFWQYIAHDKETLSPSAFERKYKYFDWYEKEL
jgi:tetratricopeptide (TPR) repeat protein